MGRRFCYRRSSTRQRLVDFIEPRRVNGRVRRITRGLTANGSLMRSAFHLNQQAVKSFVESPNRSQLSREFAYVGNGFETTEQRLRRPTPRFSGIWRRLPVHPGSSWVDRKTWKEPNMSKRVSHEGKRGKGKKGEGGIKLAADSGQVGSRLTKTLGGSF
ncbi:hypothetical protein Rcae01_03908 [Novipirellula caenicola]|uniref:Uncharacterized protein n=1 Tax=Novipirellula caenicola TaxID=1536901 RepID=A0ABP9VTG3_9BACT